MYKHVERTEGDSAVPTLKRSDDPGKSTLPGKKQIHRFSGDNGDYTMDVISLWDEMLQESKEYTSEPLLVPIIRQGK